MPAPELRTQIELMQPLPNYRGFTVTTSDASATTVIDVGSLMEEANRVTFVVELGDLYVNFNGAATSDGSSMLVPAGTGYTEEVIRVDICSQCHPFFTGEDKILDAEGRVEKFRNKYDLCLSLKYPA